MADSNSLKVMHLFEVGARLRCTTELTSLAVHLYHRFFRLHTDHDQFDLFAFGAGCFKLAHWFYELPVDSEDLALVMVSIIRGNDFLLENSDKAKLGRTIDMTADIISKNLRYEINYKDDRMLTPGRILPTGTLVNRDTDKEFFAEPIVIDPYEVDHNQTERLLLNNSKHNISAQRYLVHYLKCVKYLVEPANYNDFQIMANIAWTFLADVYWSPTVTRHQPDHLACACLMMARETMLQELLDAQLKRCERRQLVPAIFYPWNLIFCEDLDNNQLRRVVHVIYDQYREYERILQHEFHTFVIDPKISR